MPLSWSLTIDFSAFMFFVTGIVGWRFRVRWLGAYLVACFPASMIWLLQLWTVSQWIRPALLVLQVGAVIEALTLMHQNCWNPRRRYWLAGFLALCAVAGTFAAVSYPGYPKALWWVQLWVEVAATASCAASLAVWRWWRSFQPVGWTIGNVAVMGVYCGVEVAALLVSSHLTVTNWLNIDVGLALTQDVCLFWWLCLYSRNA